MGEILANGGKRLNFFVPPDLFMRAMRETLERKIKISEFLRQALEHYLETSDAEKMKRLLEEGYRNNYHSDLELNKEWESTDAS
jgi:hypothetical protein